MSLQNLLILTSTSCKTSISGTVHPVNTDKQGCKFFRGGAGRSGEKIFRPVAGHGGKNSHCGGIPPQPKSVAEIRHGGKKIAVAENRCGGKSPWLKKIFRQSQNEIHRTKISEDFSQESKNR